MNKDKTSKQLHDIAMDYYGEALYFKSRNDKLNLIKSANIALECEIKSLKILESSDKEVDGTKAYLYASIISIILLIYNYNNHEYYLKLIKIFIERGLEIAKEPYLINDFYKYEKIIKKKMNY